MNDIKPDKGLKHGSCNVTACQAPGADWYNKSTQKYYCEDCARKINWPGGRADCMALRSDADRLHGEPVGLPPVTDVQVLARFEDFGSETWQDREAMASMLAEWFNDPNRHQKPTSGDDLSEKPTMHPDLEWLASLPAERFHYVPRKHGETRKPYFYRYGSLGGHYEDRIGWGFEPTKAPNDVETFTLAEIELARQHLSKDRKRDTPARREAQQRIIERGQKLRELDKQRDAVLHPDRRYHAVWPLDLDTLPDYETWFERHGRDTCNRFGDGNWEPFLTDREATVHELYTHFRARLLDELHQAGVIGEKP